MLCQIYKPFVSLIVCCFLYPFSFLELHATPTEISEFIWNAGIAFSCDKGTQAGPKDFFHNECATQADIKNYQQIRKGDIVWIGSRCLKHFYEKILPQIKEPFVLVTSGSDRSFPSETGLKQKELNKFLSSDKILHIFAQNCDDMKSHPNISPLPIGVDFHSIAYKFPQGCWGETGSPLQQEARLKTILKNLQPTYMRKKKAFVDFQHSDNIRYGPNKRYLSLGEDRTSIFKRLLPTGVIDHGELMARSNLWQTKGQYAFSISPQGNGLDCHRTWEDLILGCIVIVKTSPLDSMYEGLPVVIVQDWSEITAENMDLWLTQYADAFTNPSYREKLTNRYWMKKIRNAARTPKL
ncbi:MAG: hypothetical protein WCG42_02415 [Parachlamydiaceae bacterium]